MLFTESLVKMNTSFPNETVVTTTEKSVHPPGAFVVVQGDDVEDEPLLPNSASQTPVPQGDSNLIGHCILSLEQRTSNL